MTTDADIITEAKSQLRLNGTQMDAIALQRLQRLYNAYCNKENWPQLLVRNATISTVAGTGAYNLPSNFGHMAGLTVDYDVTAVTGGYRFNGWPITLLSSGHPMNDTLASIQELGVVADPLYASVIGGAAGTYQLLLTPGFTNGSKTVLYSYYRLPATLAGTGTNIEIQPLVDTLIAALSKALVRYDGTRTALDEAAYFAQEEKAAYREALRTLYSY
jgi:hypothetical protein